jgi:SAM-dependent methyltransferase
MDVEPRWYEGFFEGEWLDRIAPGRPPEKTLEEVEFVAERLALGPGSRVLDLACGHGRHSVELARRGFRVTGLDLSPRSLALAREAARAAAVELELVEGDMRELAFDAEFDGIVNLFSSFGYFAEPADDALVVAGVARALRPGGRFLVDVVSALGLARRYQERRWDEVAGEAVMLEAREWDLLAGRTGAVWTIVGEDGARTELRHSIRTFAPWELATLLREGGLEVEGAWGDFAGTPLTHESWRLILLARRLI